MLALLLQGQPNKLIARELNLSVETVKDHVAAVLRALGVSSRTQAVLAVSQMTQAPGAARAPGGRRERAPLAMQAAAQPAADAVAERRVRPDIRHRTLRPRPRSRDQMPQHLRLHAGHR